MAFNTALSGLKAANSDLSVTGNNIANASTTGFKSSRAEFGDVYAVSTLGTGSNAIGSGVLLADVSQQFTQGTITSSDRSLDLAVNGNGFFVLSDAGATSYTRAGVFDLDSEGFVVANSGARLQGYGATAEGVVIEGVTGDLRIQTTTQAPNQTTEIKQEFNLDASEEVLLEIGTTSYTTGADVAVPQLGGTGNGYTAGQLNVDGVVFDIPSADNLTAAQISAEISSRNGVSATAVTTAEVSLISPFPIGGGDMTINAVAISAGTYQEMADYINGNLANVSASVNDAGDGVIVTSTIGQDIVVNVGGGAATATLTGIRTQPASDPVVLTPTSTITLGGASSVGTVGGEVILTIDDGSFVEGVTGNAFAAGPLPAAPFRNNEFDPDDQETYNHRTSTTIYDSFGNAHIMTEFYVKEPASIFGANTWSMYVQVDGRDVGDPSDADLTGAPTQARFFLRFDEDGTFNAPNSDEIVITNWSPLDAEGNPNGALTPINADAGGAVLPIPDPRTSSNYYVDIAGSTQYGTAFSVNGLSQDGYSAGQLTRLEISDTGVVQARFTNGQTQTLGQVVLAGFPSQQGLSPLGDTAWAESFESGAALIGQPQTGNLGAIQAGAREDSNVDLSSELVNLIIAQRNYQANAKTIETANAVTQTIINLR
jgi:flagellar hook protein FlgE